MKKTILILSVFLILLSIGYSKEYYKAFGREIDFINVMEFELQTGINKFKSSDVLLDAGYVPFKLTYGLLHNYEISVEWPYLFANDSDLGVGYDGIGDLKVTQKFRFTDEAPDFPTIMGGIAIEIPTSNSNFHSAGLPVNANDKVDFEIFAGAGKSFPEYNDIYLCVDLGINFIGGGDATAFDYNFGASKQLNNLVKATVELDGYKAKDYNNMFLGFGLIMQPLDTLAIKLGVPFGISSDAYSYGFVFNIINTF